MGSKSVKSISDDCPSCDKKNTFHLSWDDVEALLSGENLETKCSHCKKQIIIEKSDLGLKTSSFCTPWIVATVILFLALGVLSFYSYGLFEEFEVLEGQQLSHEAELAAAEADYDRLNQLYIDEVVESERCWEEVGFLEEDYDDLESDYNSLVYDYNSLVDVANAELQSQANNFNQQYDDLVFECNELANECQNLAYEYQTCRQQLGFQTSVDSYVTSTQDVLQLVELLMLFI